MTNEQYLYVSYFAAAVGGAGLAALTAMILAGPLRKATKAEILPYLGKLLRRAFPSWLILTALLGFISVTYFDCAHHTYAEIVADRAHLIDKTQEQVFQMTIFLAVALITYAVVLIAFLWARAQRLRARIENRAKT